MTNSRSAWPIAIFSALLGGMIAVGLAAVLGVGGSDTTTTVVRAGALASPRTASDGEEPLAARDIYKRDAPGVVFIRSNVTQQTSSPFGAPQQQQGQALDAERGEAAIDHAPQMFGARIRHPATLGPRHAGLGHDAHLPARPVPAVHRGARQALAIVQVAIVQRVGIGSVQHPDAGV